MRIRKLGIKVTRSFLSICIFSLIFALVSDFNTEKAVHTVFIDIYHAANSQSQQAVITQLDAKCSGLIKNEEEYLALISYCKDVAKLDELKKNCNAYYTSLKKNEITANVELERTCTPVVMGTIDKQCTEVNTNPQFNITAIGNVCEQHANRLISDTEFFIGYMQAIPLPVTASPSLKGLAIPFTIIIFVLIGILFMLHHEKYDELLFSIGRVLFNLGIMITLICIISILYRFVFHPDTGPILQAVFIGSGALPKEAFPILIPLILAQIFNMIYLITGILLIAGGLSLKIVYKKGAPH